MTLAELYTKLENLEGGKELIEGFKSEISRINEGAKADRLKFEKTIADLTSAHDELKGKVDEYPQYKPFALDSFQEFQSDSGLGSLRVP